MPTQEGDYVIVTKANKNSTGFHGRVVNVGCDGRLMIEHKFRPDVDNTSRTIAVPVNWCKKVLDREEAEATYRLSAGPWA